MSKVYKNYLFLVLFAPVLGYFTYYIFNGYIAWQVLSYLILPLWFIFINEVKVKLYIPKFIYFYIAYAIYIFIWRLFNGYLIDKGILKYLINNYHIYYILLILIIYNSNISNKTYLTFIKIIKVIIIVALIGVIIQFFNPTWMMRPTGWTISFNKYLNERPSIFSYVSNNDYGITVLAYFSLLLSYLSMRKKVKSLIIYTIIVGLFAFLTNARFVMLGFIMILFQLFIDNRTTKRYYYLLILIFIFIGIYYIYVNVLNINLQELYNERLFAEGSIENTTRYGAYINFLRFFPQKPIFGTGVHLTEEIRIASHDIGSSQIHVGYLSHLVSYGLVGSFLLFSFWFYLARDLYRKAKLTHYYGPFFAFLNFLWFNVTAVNYRLMWSGVVIAFVFSQYYWNNYLAKRFN